MDEEQPEGSTVTRERLFRALEASWSRDTSADPSLWRTENPSRGQCDVTSLVVLEYLGGDLQLAPVFLGEEQVEHHYWNLLEGAEVLDLTRQQFRDGQHIGDPELVSQETIRAKYPEAREELRRRHVALRTAVSVALGVRPERSLGVDA
jgi:hypothetical protein